jgi:SNF2 family DNA or RNA helicase
MPAITLHPGISNDARGALVRSFNELTDDDGKYENPDAGKARVLIANMKLLSTGYNIQRANNVCIFDLPWTPDQWAQTVGRAYRSGQTRVVRVKTFVALGNGIEGRIYYALQTHKEVTDLSFNITNGENEKKENEKREQEQRAFVRQKRQEQIEAAASIV